MESSASSYRKEKENISLSFSCIHVRLSRQRRIVFTWEMHALRQFFVEEVKIRLSRDEGTRVQIQKCYSPLPLSDPRDSVRWRSWSQLSGRDLHFWFHQFGSLVTCSPRAKDVRVNTIPCTVSFALPTAVSRPRYFAFDDEEQCEGEGQLNSTIRV